jgi:hypothetical protein
VCVISIWRKLESGGPDVEEIALIPVAIAVESKRTLSAALDDLEQIIGYVTSSYYDAVILRLRDRPSEEELRKASPLIRHGVGIVVGEDEYAPLGFRDHVIVSAGLRLRGNVSELFRRMNGKANLAACSDSSDSKIEDVKIEDVLINLSGVRRFFLLAGGGGEES